MTKRSNQSAGKSQGVGTTSAAPAVRLSACPLWLAALVLALAFCALSAFKIWRVTRLDYYNPADPRCFYWTEAAFHYRHALMVAEGAGIPRRDTLLQHPTGIEPKRHFTIFMEYPAGWLYRFVRLFVPVSFHAFLVYLTALWTSTGILAFYFMARQTGLGRGGALLLALLFAVSPYSFGRVVIGTYLREHWAFPFVILAVGASLGLMRRWAWPNAAVAAVAMFVALGSWHMTRSILLVQAVVMTGVWLWTGREQVLKALGALGAGAVLAGVAFPVLRENAFLFSTVMILLYAAPLAAALGHTAFLRRRRLLLLPVLVVIFVCLHGLVHVLGASETFAHVRELIVAKLVNLGRKPLDPRALSYEARTMWVASFMSPEPGMIWLMLMSTLPLGAAGILVRLCAWRRRPPEPAELTVLGLAAAFLLLFLLIVRLAPLAGVFLTLCAGFLLPGESRVARAALALVCVAVAAQAVALPRLKIAKEQKMLGQRLMLVDWIRANTPPDASFLTTVGMGSTLSTYAGRPIILHSKYENLDVRKRVQGFLTALYQDEAAFYAYCRQYDVDYFVYETSLLTDHSLFSDRYTADAMRVSRRATAYRCHYAPETLEHLERVYQTAYFRLFRVVAGTPQRRRLAFHPIYYEPLLGQKPDEPCLNDAALDRVYQSIVKAQDAHAMAQAYERAGNAPAQEAALADSIRACGLYTPALVDLSRIRAERKDYPTALALIEKVLQVDPDMPKALLFRGNILCGQGQFAAAAQSYERILTVDPDHASALKNLGLIYTHHLGQRPRAAELLRRYLALCPDDPQRKELEGLVGGE
ncbi:MAG: tetratricopeptide repeat protein [Kiritimatiellae bacterium]|nr:tetratricopeptide repeat protein [Kiritimatiellia bacterium]